MSTRTIFLPDLSSSDEEAWRPLAVRSSEPHPFHEADLLVRACRSSKNGKSAVLGVAEEAGHFHACLPARVVNLPRILPPPVTTFWRHLYGFLP
jgi:hypothetical protein